jgi:hypothetical protein
MKDYRNRTPDRPGKGESPGRTSRDEADARLLARIRRAAAVVHVKQEGIYDRLADRFRAAFDAGAGRGREAMLVAAERARGELVQAGATTPHQSERLKECLLRDVDRLAAEFRAAGEAAFMRLDPSRLEPGALACLVAVLRSAVDHLHEFDQRADTTLAFRTGEVTSAGRLHCLECGQALALARTATVPPCARCRSTRFRKSY